VAAIARHDRTSQPHPESGGHHCPQPSTPRRCGRARVLDDRFVEAFAIAGTETDFLSQIQTILRRGGYRIGTDLCRGPSRRSIWRISQPCCMPISHRDARSQEYPRLPDRAGLPPTATTRGLPAAGADGTDRECTVAVRLCDRCAIADFDGDDCPMPPMSTPGKSS